MESINSLDRAVARVPHSIWRTGGALVTAIALSWRLGTRHEYRSGTLFWLETAVPMMILAAYLTRPAPVRPARGFDAIVLPFIAAGLPFAFLYPPFTAWGRAHLDLFVLLLIPPTALMVISWSTCLLLTSLSFTSTRTPLPPSPTSDSPAYRG